MAHFNCVSQTEKETLQFNWTVERLSTYGGLPTYQFPSFRPPNGLYSLHFTLFPKFKNTEYYLRFLMWPENKSKSLGLVSAHVEVRLQDRKGVPWKVVKEYCNFNCGGLPILLAEDLRSPKWRQAVVDDKLRIQCSICFNSMFLPLETRRPSTDRNVTSGKDSNVTSGNDRKVTEAKTTKPLEDFGSVMNDSDFADVTLITKTKTFRAHKAILAARSKVFRAMFKSPMAEAASGVVNISDFDKEAVQGMLQHIYKGQVDNLGDKARDLLKIADKYDLPGLKEEAEVSIANTLTVETAADDLVLAHMFNTTVLKSKVVQFITRNKDEVKKTGAFQSVLKSDPGLLLELLFLSSGSGQ